MPFSSHSEPRTHRGDADVFMPSGASVLILDGNSCLRTALKNNFLRHGWRVSTAASFSEAFRVIDQQAFDLVVSGLSTRDGEIDKLIAVQRESGPGTRTIVLTSHVGVSDVVEAMRAGAFDVLSKDTAFDVLQAAARNALQAFECGHGEAGERESSAQRGSGMTLSELNRKCLEDALALAEGNRTNAAKMLGISVRTVRNKIRQYGLPPRSYA